MSDDQFELQKEIASVQQLKSFGKFMNSYVSKKEQPIIHKSAVFPTAEIKNSQESSSLYGKRDQVPQSNRSIQVLSPKGGQDQQAIKSQRYPQQFEHKLSVSMQPDDIANQKLRMTQEKGAGLTGKRRDREFSRLTQKDPYNPVNLQQKEKIQQRQSYHKMLSLKQANTMPSRNLVGEPREHELHNYKSKFQQISTAFEQFKQVSMVEKRRQNQQLYDQQQKVEELKARIYDIEVREDQLIMENKRLKEKMSKQFRSEKESRQFKSSLDTKSEELRRSIQQIAYWKGQSQNSRKDLQSANLNNERFELELREYRERLECQQMEIQNKEAIQKDLTAKISALIKENGRLRDDVGELSRINREYEYQSLNIKRELKRCSQTGPADRNSGQNKPSSRQEALQDEQPRKQEGKRRRGEFNHQRQKINQKKQPGSIRDFPPSTRKQANPKVQLLLRKQRLQEQVRKIREQRPLTGAMRRKKIQLQKELQETYTKLEEVSGEAHPRI